jgi:hypothetical protein
VLLLLLTLPAAAMGPALMEAHRPLLHNWR